VRRNLILVLFLLLLVLPVVRADGCKFMSDGRKVREREQRALIEWDNGTETLYVAAFSDPTSEGTVWVVPVRAPATAVRAEPVEQFPAVVYYETLKNRAVRDLRSAIAVTGILNSGGLCCFPFMGGCGGAGPKPAVEASRVEKLGMVVVVLTAESRAAMKQYLDEQGVNRAAVDLSSLDPYFGRPEYAFVCGWVAKRYEPAQATALKVTFPSPTLWFPLQPTRAYTEPVETVVFVRGFAKPAPGCDLPGLKCQYIYGAVKELSLGQAFTEDKQSYEYGHYSGTLEPLTRVTLTTDPQQWDRDLELVPGTTAVGTVALTVKEWSNGIAMLWSGALGALLGLFIPWLTIAKADRSRIDWLAGALTGAFIVLTIWASAVVFAIWRSQRFGDQPKQPSRYLVLPALALVHFGIVLAVCNGLIRWITAGA
jgi:hypothetical protein